MPLCQSHIKWMTQAWSKRLCQSCGLPVSQVLMCALSATLTEKIGHLTHFQQPSYHLQSIQRFLPFLVDVSEMSLWVSDSVSLLLCSCTVIFCLVVFIFSCFNDSNPDIGKKRKSREEGGKQFIPVPMVTVKWIIPWRSSLTKQRGLGGFMVTVGYVEFLIRGLKGIQTFIIIFFSFHKTHSAPAKINPTTLWLSALLFVWNLWVCQVTL